MKASSLRYLCEYVERRAAIILDAEKDYLIETRLAPVMTQFKLKNLEKLVEALQANRTLGLESRVIEAMTTNETFFFRDKVPFEAFEKDVLPKLIEARKNARKLRLWCGAASTGQEPYSIAMLLVDRFPELTQWDLTFEATDINETVLQRAREGLFKAHEVNRGLEPRLKQRFFQQKGNRWQIDERLRKMIKFSRLNLIDPWRWEEPFDVVFLRNVLIYFNVPTKQRILRRVRESMRPDAVLFLGGAETTVNIDNAFDCHRNGRKIYYSLAA